MGNVIRNVLSNIMANRQKRSVGHDVAQKLLFGNDVAQSRSGVWVMLAFGSIIFTQINK